MKMGADRHRPNSGHSHIPVRHDAKNHNNIYSKRRAAGKKQPLDAKIIGLSQPPARLGCIPLRAFVSTQKTCPLPAHFERSARKHGVTLPLGTMLYRAMVKKSAKQ